MKIILFSKMTDYHLNLLGSSKLVFNVISLRNEAITIILLNQDNTTIVLKMTMKTLLEQVGHHKTFKVRQFEYIMSLYL